MNTNSDVLEVRESKTPFVTTNPSKAAVASASILDNQLSLIDWAHISGRFGLALIGATCGLYVAALLARQGFGTGGSDWLVVVMMLYGAVASYVGIDLPRRHPSELLHGSSGTDTARLSSGAGTFLAAVAASFSVAIIVLDETVSHQFSIVIVGCWVIGASFQITAGTIARTQNTR